MWNNQQGRENTSCFLEAWLPFCFAGAIYLPLCRLTPWIFCAFCQIEMANSCCCCSLAIDSLTSQLHVKIFFKYVIIKTNISLQRDITLVLMISYLKSNSKEVASLLGLVLLQPWWWLRISAFSSGFKASDCCRVCYDSVTLLCETVTSRCDLCAPLGSTPRIKAVK